MCPAESSPPGSAAESGQSYLSLREAAARLGVGYQTVYRLVREGTLPAVRVRSVWRIGASDLDEWLRRQPRQLPDRDDATTCGACGRPMRSALGLGGRCPVCAAPICLICWRADARRHCAEHRPDSEPPPAHVAVECARCRRVIADLSSAGGSCEESSCDAVLCVDCWRETHRCAAHLTAGGASFGDATARLARGEIPVLVASLEAKSRETSFIARFDHKVRAIATLRHPTSGEALRVANWERRHRAGDETPDLIARLRLGFLARDIEDRIPLNLRSRYVVATSDARADAVVLEAVVVSDLVAHVRDAFATAPTPLSELVPRLTAYGVEAERDGSVVVVGLAATAGWADEATTFVCGTSAGAGAALVGGYMHPRVLPYLVDLSVAGTALGNVRYNVLDERLAPFADLFSPRTHAEEAQIVAEHIKACFAGSGRDYVTCEAVAAELAIHEDVVRRAFERLASMGTYALDDVPGAGLVLSRR